MKREALEKELAKIVDISREFGARKVLLFGSCLSDMKSARDIDIAVSGIKPRDFFKFYGKVSMFVDDEVDLIDLDDIREHLRNRIFSKGKLIYKRVE
ncbi:MAG: nucleotidyltransferase domain-containing protein [candidate division Zixibacteria bacterium]|nr:nucleotidyltransferase domain-containing protein [candidate division Zixibacteria bacterium]